MEGRWRTSSGQSKRQGKCALRAVACLLPEPNQTQSKGPGSVGSGLLWASVAPVRLGLCKEPRTDQKAQEPRTSRHWLTTGSDWISPFQAEPGCPHLSPLGPFGRPISHEDPPECRPMFAHPLRCN